MPRRLRWRCRASSLGDHVVEVPLSGKRGRGLFMLIDAAMLPIFQTSSWSVGTHGYVESRRAGELVRAHRLVLPGVPLVDHKNRDKLDNRTENLRPATPTLQAQNTGRRARGAGIIDLPNGTFQARVTVNRRVIHLGTYKTRDAALRARRFGEEKYYAPQA